MKAVALKLGGGGSGHRCPPSDATHPSDRWETAFVYAFIHKFTQIKDKVEGFETVTNLEEALLSPTQHPIMVQILTRFILNLKPQTRNLSPETVSSTLTSLFLEFMKTLERTVFFDEEKGMNVEPLQNVPGGFWGADWDLKLRILRQLVEWQLTHHAETKELIDRAMGVVHNKHKKKDPNATVPEPDEPHNQEWLSTVPLGQDAAKKRYWVLDDSPRLYVSTNPWKVSSTFKAVATTKEDYIKAIESLKINPTSPTKNEVSQLNLVTMLEKRVEAIDVELQRVQKVRRKIELRELAKVQAEMRETRTRRQTRRPDYVYHEDGESDDGGGDYIFQDEEEEEGPDEFRFDTPEPRLRGGRRRSQRTAVLNANGKRNSDTGFEWRGERRSSRLNTLVEPSNPPMKRARTDESSVSGPASEAASHSSEQKSNAPELPKATGVVRPDEIVLEQVAGKKRSRFWFYAVQPAPSPTLTNGQAAVNGDMNRGSNEEINNAGYPEDDSKNGTNESVPPPPRLLDART